MNATCNRLPARFREREVWQKTKTCMRKAGHAVIETVLTALYTLQDRDTPLWAKSVIASALAYFIMPLDAVPDFLPGGYTDDMAVLLAALATVYLYVTPEFRARAKAKAKEWFG